MVHNDGFLSDRIRMIMTLRREGITDMQVLNALETTPREYFIPAMFQDKAYADIALPIEGGQTISQPSVVAWMTCALELHDRCRVLEIGTGSGYQTTILSRLCRMVYTIERHKHLMELAEERFKALELKNVITRVSDGTKGWSETAPFDRIIVTAAAQQVPAALLEQLSVGGIMVIPVGEPVGEQVLLRIERDAEGYSSQHLLNVRFVPLIEGKIAS